jgi:signal peptidase
MALKTLEEFNRDFMLERYSAYSSDKPESIPIDMGMAIPQADVSIPIDVDVSIPIDVDVFSSIDVGRETPQADVFRPIDVGVEIPHAQVFEIHRANRLEQPQKPARVAASKRFAPPIANSQPSKKKKRGTVAIISDILFYLAILVVLATTALAGQGDGTPKMILGYADFTVLTSSMEGEIPKGSFILVHRTDSQSLQVGDNITFMRDASTSVTHKIIDIYEDYQDSGDRGFQTKGVHNTNPDKDIVYADKIIGKVVLVIPFVGALLLYLRSNLHLVFIIFGVFILLSFCLRWLFAKTKKRNGQDDIKDLYKAAASGLSVARTARKEVAALHK